MVLEGGSNAFLFRQDIVRIQVFGRIVEDSKWKVAVGLNSSQGVNIVSLVSASSEVRKGVKKNEQANPE